MNLARVSNNGQITVPVEIRRALKIKAGDKMVFFRKSNGEIVVNNTSLVAVEEAQNAVAGSNYSEDLRYEGGYGKPPKISWQRLIRSGFEAVCGKGETVPPPMYSIGEHISAEIQNDNNEIGSAVLIVVFRYYRELYIWRKHFQVC